MLPFSAYLIVFFQLNGQVDSSLTRFEFHFGYSISNLNTKAAATIFRGIPDYFINRDQLLVNNQASYYTGVDYKKAIGKSMYWRSGLFAQYFQTKRIISEEHWDRYVPEDLLSERNTHYDLQVIYGQIPFAIGTKWQSGATHFSVEGGLYYNFALSGQQTIRETRTDHYYIDARYNADCRCYEAFEKSLNTPAVLSTNVEEQKDHSSFNLGLLGGFSIGRTLANGQQIALNYHLLSDFNPVLQQAGIVNDAYLQRKYYYTAHQIGLSYTFDKAVQIQGPKNEIQPRTFLGLSLYFYGEDNGKTGYGPSLTFNYFSKKRIGLEVITTFYSVPQPAYAQTGQAFDVHLTYELIANTLFAKGGATFLFYNDSDLNNLGGNGIQAGLSFFKEINPNLYFKADLHHRYWPDDADRRITSGFNLGFSYHLNHKK